MSRNLTNRQEKALRALLESRDVEAAAVTAGVTARTVYRYLAEPTFRAELSRLEGIAIDAAARRLVSIVQPAIDAVQDILEGERIPPGVRLRAAGLVLDNLIRLREYQVLEARVSELERREYGESKK